MPTLAEKLASHILEQNAHEDEFSVQMAPDLTHAVERALRALGAEVRVDGANLIVRPQKSSGTEA